MIFLVYLGGVITGAITLSIIFGLRETYGELLIDPKEDTCMIKMDTKKVILVIDHNADLSQK